MTMRFVDAAVALAVAAAGVGIYQVAFAGGRGAGSRDPGEARALATLRDEFDRWAAKVEPLATSRPEPAGIGDRLAGLEARLDAVERAATARAEVRRTAAPPPDLPIPASPDERWTEVQMAELRRLKALVDREERVDQDALLMRRLVHACGTELTPQQEDAATSLVMDFEARVRDLYAREEPRGPDVPSDAVAAFQAKLADLRATMVEALRGITSEAAATAIGAYAPPRPMDTHPGASPPGVTGPR